LDLFDHGPEVVERPARSRERKNDEEKESNTRFVDEAYAP
jgi:hypothetical protein